MLLANEVENSNVIKARRIRSSPAWSVSTTGQSGKQALIVSIKEAIVISKEIIRNMNERNEERSKAFYS